MALEKNHRGNTFFLIKKYFLVAQHRPHQITKENIIAFGQEPLLYLQIQVTMQSSVTGIPFKVKEKLYFSSLKT